MEGLHISGFTLAEVAMASVLSLLEACREQGQVITQEQEEGVIACLANASADDLRATNEDDETVLMVAVGTHGTQRVIQALLSRPEVLETVNAQNVVGWTSVYYATAELNAEAICYLAQAGADLNLPESLVGNTPLHASVYSNNVFVLNELLHNGALPLKTAHNGLTPLEVAMKLSHEQCAGLIRYYQTLLRCASLLEQLCCEQLLRHDLFQSDRHRGLVRLISSYIAKP